MTYEFGAPKFVVGERVDIVGTGATDKTGVHITDVGLLPPGRRVVEYATGYNYVADNYHWVYRTTAYPDTEVAEENLRPTPDADRLAGVTWEELKNQLGVTEDGLQSQFAF